VEEAQKLILQERIDILTSFPSSSTTGSLRYFVSSNSLYK